MSKNITVSIIIVNYKSEDLLFGCIDSIYASTSGVSFEVIVVDNNEENDLKQNLKKHFPFVFYIKSSKNLGYGVGNNLGEKYSCGEYLFFLNPDALLKRDCIEKLVQFLKKHNKVGAVAPLILNNDEKPYEKQGAKALTFYEGIMTFSLLGKLFHHSNFLPWDKKSDIQVGVIPGTAFMIKKTLFKECGGFDKNYFLYFEESDISERIKEKGYDLYMLFSAQVVHFWGESTKKSSKNLKTIFSKSRYYYFRKNYGFIRAILIELLARIDKYIFLFFIVIVVGTFLRFYKLSENMIFLGDFGWFYNSARDMIIYHFIPLVGITASRTWLHQGPLWTYILGLGFLVSNFNPLSGGIIASFMGVVTVITAYLVTKELFTKKIALIVSVLSATSPLIIVFSRMPYHTSLIPFFVFLYVLVFYKWIRGNVLYFPLVLLTLCILYNFELATVVFSFPVLVFLIYGFFRKKEYVKQLWNKKILTLSLISFFPMVPVFAYDTTHNFPQTIKFGGWIMYQFFNVFNLNKTCCTFGQSEMISFFLFQYTRIVFLPSIFIATIIFVVSLFINSIKVFKNGPKNIGEVIFYIMFIIGIASFIGTKTPSEAYLPMLFPFLIMSVALALNEIKLKYVTVSILIIIIGVNIVFLFKKDFFMNFKTNPEGYVYGPGLEARIIETKKIVQHANGKAFSIQGGGFLSQFDANVDNYRYLAWWLGGNINKSSLNKYIIYDTSANISKHIIYKDGFVTIVKND